MHISEYWVFIIASWNSRLIIVLSFGVSPRLMRGFKEADVLREQTLQSICRRG